MFGYASIKLFPVDQIDDLGEDKSAEVHGRQSQ